MIYVVLSGFAAAALAPFIVRLTPSWSGRVLSLLPLGLLVFFAQFTRGAGSSQRHIFRYAWLPDLNIHLSFCLDGLSLLFCLLITGVGSIVCIYSSSYLAGRGDLDKFYCTLFVFMASMLGLVLSDNLIALFMFWELTSVSSYLLIAYEHQRESARKAALQALLVTGFGATALLAAISLMGGAAGTYEISQMADQNNTIRSSPHYPFMIFLLLLGIASKSAQTPFHFWLPNAMEAPAPVSTYLHSATMVKAGVYLAARLTPVLGDTELWQWALTPMGALTMVTGAWLALLQSDLKRVLAYTTVSALGMMIFLIGLGTPLSLSACMIFITAHALYKGALFLAAGIIDHETGTRDIQKLGKLAKAMPITCFSAALAAFSSAGLPPFLGFLGKEMLYASALLSPFPALLTVAAVGAGISFVAAGGIAGLRPFFQRKAELPKEAHEAPGAMWVGPLVLGILGLVCGWMPERLHNRLLVPATWAALGKCSPLELPSDHGLDLKLAMTLATFVLGGCVYWKWDALQKALQPMRALGEIGPSRLYEITLSLLERFALFQARFIQNGHLHFYLLTIIGTSVLLIGWSLFESELSLTRLGLQRWSDTRLPELMIALVILVAAVLTARADSMLMAIVGLGVVGYGMAMIFLLFSAPDLAMTQFAIETLSVVLLVLVLFKLPQYRPYSSRSARLRDALAAVSAGTLITLIILLVTSQNHMPRLVSYFAEKSLSLAKGRNVVNVILVDFRGFDTLGEITVLSVAAMGVLALLKLKSRKRAERGDETTTPNVSGPVQ